MSDDNFSAMCQSIIDGAPDTAAGLAQQAVSSSIAPIDAINLVADQVPAVAAGHAQGTATQQETRRKAQSFFGCAAQRKVDLMRRAAIAHSRYAGVQRAQRVDGGVHERDHLIQRRNDRCRRSLRPHGEVDVAVDKAGQQRPAGQIDVANAG